MIRILCIDDDELFLQSLERTLRVARRQWGVDLAYDPKHAAERLQGNDYNVIVLDVHMPGRNGISCLREIRSNPRLVNTPVIVLTGSDDSEIKHKMLRSGATDLLTKPCDSEEFVARLDNMIKLDLYQKTLDRHNVELEKRLDDKQHKLDYAQRSILWRLAKAGEYRDEETGMHVFRVGEVCKIIAENMGMSAGDVQCLTLAAPLHDIGKIGIPDNILLKPGALDADEMAIMKTHCQIGADILSQYPRGMLEWMSLTGNSIANDAGGENELLEMASVIAMSHHERWDGGGYPNGLSGEDIPLVSRIVNLSDSFDALCSARPYKPAFPLEKVLEIMEGQIGGQFDPAVYGAFHNNLEDVLEVRRRLMDKVLTSV